MNEGIVLGHLISAYMIKPDLAKNRDNLENPTSEDTKRGMYFPGSCRVLIEKISNIASPLFSLLMKEGEFVWIGKCEKAIVKWKEYVSTTPILWGMNLNMTFHIATDVADTIGGDSLG